MILAEARTLITVRAFVLNAARTHCFRRIIAFD
jgi:hypothetical protein